MKESTLAELLSALDIVVMEQNEDFSFGLVGRVPAWFKALCPEAVEMSGFWPGRRFAYLSNFLPEAEKLWATKGSNPLPSGSWIEHDDLGEAVAVEATAVMVGQQRLVLLEKLSDFSQEKQAIIQQALGLQMDYWQWQKMKNTLLEAREDTEKKVVQRTEKLRQSYQHLKQVMDEDRKPVNLFKQNELLLHSIFDSIRDGLIILDLNFSILRANLAMADIWGMISPLEERKCFAAWQGRQTPCPWCTAAITMEKGKVLWKEISSPSEAESQSRLRLATFPLRNDKGQVIGVIEYFRDLTKHQQTAAQEDVVSEQVREAKIRKGQRILPRSLRHDFNNILNSLLGYTEMALLCLSDPQQAGETRFFLEEAFRAEELAEDLIRQI